VSRIDIKVGNKEIHNISFKMNRFWGKYSIHVDEDPIKNGWLFVIGSKVVSFDVGIVEKHNININWNVPPFRGFRNWETKVFIDGTLHTICKL
jgi:hypothetical protein